MRPTTSINITCSATVTSAPIVSLAMSNETFMAAASNSSLPVLEDAQRAREVYRYLAPDNLVAGNPKAVEGTCSTTSGTDLILTKALTPFVQLAALQCNAQRALLR